ncbi:glycosyltransferase [Alteromonas sp. 345S023]|uniref:Glycosyltransferase n=1 Tax=Alteromonas profundi TaxID=2696062 RepID=A0A7X5RK48_9ALTE|nr:glycosyltransferase [Alteromonas profundi]NDV89985.1 glycosyltransferase [Alteromonas profundi]
MLHIVVIGYVWPEPNSSAAGQNMLSIIKRFVNKNHKVTFVTAATDSVHKADLDNLGVSCESIELNSNSFDHRIAALAPDIVIFDRYMSEEQFAWRVKENCPNALRVLNTEDLHSLRQARHEAVKRTGDAADADLSSLLAQREVAAILRSDITLILSKAEMRLLTDFYRVPKQQLYYLPLDVGEVLANTPSFHQRQDIVTIGNFRHAPNWDAVLQLKQTIWPKIRQALPHVNLRIYGAYPPKKATQLHNPKQGFFVEGWAEEATTVISNAKILIAPVRFGAGIKGKLLDAMRCATPSLTTWIGAEGLGELIAEENAQNLWGGAICATPEEFAHHAKHLYTNEEAWTQAASQGMQIFSAYQKETNSGHVINTLEQLVTTRDAHRQGLFLQSLLWHQTLNASKYMSQWIEAKNKHPS